MYTFLVVSASLCLCGDGFTCCRFVKLFKLYMLSFFLKIVTVTPVVIMLTLFWLQMFSLCLNSHGCIFCPNVFVVLVEPDCFMFTLFWLYLLPFCTKGLFLVTWKGCKGCQYIDC